jgi:hypothetical protein
VATLLCSTQVLTLSEPAAILCPYCGKTQPVARRCAGCGGHFDRWSLAATRNEMGPWFIRDDANPHFVGLGYDAIVEMIRSHELDRDAAVRGPTTGQFWTLARRAPGLAHHFGRCHACQGPVDPQKPRCETCGEAPPQPPSRNDFGLPPIAPVEKPVDAMPDFGAFSEDARLLVVSTRRGADTPMSTSREPAPNSPQHGAQRAEGSAHRTAEPRDSAHVDSAVSQHRAAVLDRSLVDRARSLERTNRWLILFAVMGFASALLFVLAYAREVRARDKAVADARAAVRKEFAGDTKRGTPVAPSPQPELPPMPQTPSR